MGADGDAFVRYTPASLRALHNRIIMQSEPLVSHPIDGASSVVHASNCATVMTQLSS